MSWPIWILAGVVVFTIIAEAQTWWRNEHGKR